MSEQKTSKYIRIYGLTMPQMAEKYNVILTPHNAFNTKEAVLRKAQQSIDSIMFFLKYPLTVCFWISDKKIISRFVPFVSPLFVK